MIQHLSRFIGFRGSVTDFRAKGNKKDREFCRLSTFLYSPLLRCLTVRLALLLLFCAFGVQLLEQAIARVEKGTDLGGHVGMWALF